MKRPKDMTPEEIGQLRWVDPVDEVGYGVIRGDDLLIGYDDKGGASGFVQLADGTWRRTTGLTF